MSNVATETVQAHVANLKLNAEPAPRLDLKTYPRTEITPALGLRFNNDLRLKEILNKPQEEKEEFFKALAYEISLNGVAVFPKQSELSKVDLEEVAALLQKYSGAPQDAGFHIHPAQLDFDQSVKGGNILAIGAREETRRLPDSELSPQERRIASEGWHADITFEKRPASYSLFQVHTLPRTGGDTVFLSQYAVYDKLTPPFQQLLEGLTATHSGKKFHEAAAKHNFELFAGPRGAAENVGTELIAHHPVVRTNPLTNLKAVFVNPGFTQYIDDLNYDESKAILEYIFKLQSESHDLSLRQHWEKDDLAIWDNRSTLHSATFDYGRAVRIANRSTVIGEIPYFDKNSLSKKQYHELHPQRLDQTEIQL